MPAQPAPAPPAPAATVEEWRPIPDNPAYEVSSHGRVRNAETHHIKSQNWSNRRPFVCLYRPEQRRRQVAGLVAAAFLGPKPEGKQIEHLDQNPANNHVSNLAYVTQSENIRRSFRLTKRKKRNGPRLSPATYEVIRELWAAGEHSQVAIATMLGVTNATVSRIVRSLREACGSLDLDRPDPELLEKYRRRPVLDKAQIRELRSQGHSLREVSELLGCSLSWVRQVVHQG